MKAWAAMIAEPACVLLVHPQEGVRRVSVSHFCRNVDRMQRARFRAHRELLDAHHLAFDATLQSATLHRDCIGRPVLTINPSIFTLLAAREAADLWTLCDRLFSCRVDAAAAFTSALAIAHNSAGLTAQIAGAE